MVIGGRVDQLINHKLEKLLVERTARVAKAKFVAFVFWSISGREKYTWLKDVGLHHFEFRHFRFMGFAKGKEQALNLPTA